MFVDYVTLMLINLVAGLFLLAGLLVCGLDADDRRKWAPGFAVAGLIALACGLHMAWTWPLPGSYNILFGESSALFGTVCLGVALGLGMNRRLTSVALYGVFPALAAIVLGAGVMHKGMTQSPLFAGLGFIVTGVGALLFCAAVLLRSVRALRWIGAVALVIAALVWALIGYVSYWKHLGQFSGYAPGASAPAETR